MLSPLHALSVPTLFRNKG